MLNTAARRLPGIRFEPRAAPLVAALPRMDVAVFVGFAASGPLNLPVAVEDPGQFRAIFGDDIALARDPETGETAGGLLAPTVRAFFANGGRRCWIIRVAGEDARFNHFPIPGLLAADTANADAATSLRPAFARARSKGSWSDALRVASSLRMRPLQLAAPYDGGDMIRVRPTGPVPAGGDLLRITGADGARVVFAEVRRVAPHAGSPPEAPELDVGLGRRIAFESGAFPGSPPGPVATRVRIFTMERKALAGAALPTRRESMGHHPFAKYVSASMEPAARPEHSGGVAKWMADLSITPAEAPSLGTWIQIKWNREWWWLMVEEHGLGAERGAGSQRRRRRRGRCLRVRGSVWRSVPPAGAFAGVTDPVAEIVTLDLKAFAGLDATWTLHDLGLTSGHERCWSAMPVDEDFYAPPHAIVGKISPGTSAQHEGAAAARFPLAGEKSADLLFLPLAVPGAFSVPTGPVARADTPLTRDGLESFDTAMFLDPEMQDVGIERFMEQADFLRYLCPEPRQLRGIHAALGWRESSIIEEATLIAVPDAVHRPWNAPELMQQPKPTAGPLIAQPDWWHHLPCDPARKIVLVEDPDRSVFQDSDIRKITAPLFLPGVAPDSSGTFTLHWNCPEPDARFIVEESGLPDFADAVVVYEGAASSLTLYGRSAGHYYFRVRAVAGRNASHWSEPRYFAIPSAPEAMLQPAREFNAAPLLSIQRALLRLCAGSGGLFSVLSLPAHYREKDAFAHAAQLAGGTSSGVEPTVPPIGSGEARALSYGALYHPWMIVRQTAGGLMRIPADGAASGVLASRAAIRGAWIAPANEPLREVVALAPALPPWSWPTLQDAGINLLRREPRGFLFMGADTLSLDPNLRPINVRRLLILLRRLALRRGADYVFEPLSAAFRRQVQRGFEALLFELFQRGAFAGASPAASYQVATGPDVNPPRNLEQGRFVVDIKVAPALPLTFLNIRLVNAGDRFAVLEGA